VIPAAFLRALFTVREQLLGTDVIWAVTGSLGMALQGLDLPVHDIDLQTDERGAYAIEGRLARYVVRPVRYTPSERMRSHLGMLRIHGVKVEIIGGIQKRLDDGTWEEPTQVDLHRKWLDVRGEQVPVMSLEYEYDAYRKMGRAARASMLRKWLETNKSK